MVRLVLCAIAWAWSAAHGATIALPAPDEWRANPGVAPPGETWEATSFTGQVRSESPVVSGWNRNVVRPDESFTLTGARFSRRSGAAHGSDTVVWLWTTGMAAPRACPIWDIQGDSLLMAMVPADVPFGTFFVWVENEAGASAPICLNRTEANWIGPLGRTVPPNAAVPRRVFGKNLSFQQGKEQAFVYLKRAGSSGLEPLTVRAANPYMIEFATPPNLAAGRHEIWVHRGHGGPYGWSGPLELVAEAPFVRDAFVQRIEASGGDDTAALQAAINAIAARPGGGTLELGAGTFRITSVLDLKDKVRLAGAGMNLTTLNISNPGKPRALMNIRGNTELDGMRLQFKSVPAYYLVSCESATYNPLGGDYRNVRWKNVALDCDNNLPFGYSHLAQARLECSALEITGCEFYQALHLGSVDGWVHHNRFYGGFFGGDQVYLAEGALNGDSTRFVMEHNHFETLNWPNVNGNRNYEEIYSYEEMQWFRWCRRVWSSGAGNRDVFAAFNTGKDVAILDNKGEQFRFHGFSYRWRSLCRSRGGWLRALGA